MATRTITSTILRPNGEPWAGGVVRFALLDDAFTVSPPETVPTATISTVADDDGAMTVTLVSGLSSAYKVTLPDREQFDIVVPDGATTTLELLRADSDVSPVPPETIETVVDAILAAWVTGGPFLPGLNVRDAVYGETDDSAAIQAAIAAAILTGGGLIWLPKTTYDIDADLAWAANYIDLRGAGIGNTILDRSGSTNHVLNFGAEGSSLRDLTIDGSGSAAAGGAHGARVYGKYQLLERLLIDNAKEYGLGLGQQDGDTLWNLIVMNTIIRNARNDAVDIKNKSNTNRTQFFTNLVIDGFDLDNGGNKGGLDMRGPVLVAGLEVRGRSSNGSAADFESDGINGDGAHGSSLVNAYLVDTDPAFGGCKGIAITATRVNVANADLQDFPRGFAIGAADAAIVNTFVDDATTAAYEIAAPRAHLANTRARDTPIGYDISASDATLTNTSSEATTAQGIRVRTGVYRTTIIGHKFVGSSGVAAQIDGGAVDTTFIGCDFTEFTGTKVSDGGANTRFFNCPGYLTRNGGESLVANGGTIAHLLPGAPKRYRITPTVAGRVAVITAASAATLTVSLQTDAGVAVTTAEKVSWEAEYQPEPSRFYFDATNAAAVSPAFAAEWEDTSAAVRRVLTRPKGTTALTNLTVNELANTNPNEDQLIAQFVSGNLSAQTIAGTFKGQILCQENNSAANLSMQCIIRVVDSAGTTVRGTLYAGDLTIASSGLADEWVAATNTNRKLNTIQPVTLTPVTLSANDRLVVEIGYREHNTSATIRSGTIRVGEAGIADLPEDTTTTTDLTPWIEFSQPII